MKQILILRIGLFHITAALLALILCTGDIQAQYSSDVFNLKTSSDLYDQRGFLSGNGALNVDGRLIVNSANGNISYSYPLAERVVSGRTINYTLNYCGSVAFTAYGKYTSSAEPFTGWKQFHQNRPAWILGVGEFAVQVLAITSSFLCEPKVTMDYFASSSPKHAYEDESFVWTIDGYDICNRMDDFNASGRTKPAVDMIRLLKADGSVLELMNRSSQTYEDAYAHAGPVTGYYVVNASNHPGYAIVTHDSSNWGSYMRNRSGQTGYSKVPRIVRYYPGDGLVYCFREWPAPYGIQMTRNEAFAADLFDGGLANAGPTIFYLEEVLNNDGGVAYARYSRHFYPNAQTYVVGGNIYNPQVDSTLDSTKGRAACVDMSGVNLIYGDDRLLIEAFGRTIKVRFDTVARSGYRGDQLEPYGMPIATYERQAFEYARLPYQVPAGITPYASNRYRSYVGYVTEIADIEENRITRFDYGTYVRMYHGFYFPDDCSGCSGLTDGPTIGLKNYRLTEVTEPTTRYTICYHRPITTGSASGENCGPDTFTVAAGSPNGGQPYAMNNVVRTVRKYDRGGALQLSQNYEFAFPTSGGRTWSNATTAWVRIKDHVTDSVRTTIDEFKYRTLHEPFPYVRKPIFVDNWQSTDSTGSMITRTFTISDSLPQSPYIWLPKEQRVYRAPGDNTDDTTLVRLQRYTYETDTVSDFGGNDTLAGRFGMAVSRKFITTYDPASRRPIRFDTIDYAHYGRIDTALTQVDTLYPKFISEEEFLKQVDTNEYVELPHERLMRSVGVRLDSSRIIKYLPPLYGLEKRKWGYDSSGNYLGGEIFAYSPTGDPGHYLNQHLFRGRLIGDTLIDRTGRHFMKQSLEYYRSFGLNAPSWLLGPNGAEQRMYYVSYASNTLFENGPWGLGYYALGQIRRNDDSLRDTLLPNIQLYSLLYQKPLVTQSIIRKYRSDGTLLRDTLDRLHSYSFYGQEVTTVDENKWLSRFEYDPIGRLRYAWLPGDFPREGMMGDTGYAHYEAIDGFGWSYTAYRIDTLVCEDHGVPDSTVYRGVEMETEETAGCFASRPLQMRDLTCSDPYLPKARKKGDGSTSQSFIDARLFVGFTETVANLLVPIDTTRLRSFSSIDSGKFRLFIAGFNPSCVVMKVSGISLPFYQSYVFGCPPIRRFAGSSGSGSKAGKDEGNLQSSASAVPSTVAGEFTIDIGPALDSLRTRTHLPQYIGLEIRTSTAGGNIQIAAGFNGDETRPRIQMWGPSARISSVADYTVAYTYDDQIRTDTVMAKVDDLDHTSNHLSPGNTGGRGVRRSMIVNNFGPDYSVRSTELHIGNPSMPIRIDSVLTRYTGLNQKRTVVDQVEDSVTTRYDGLGRPLLTINADGTSSSSAYYFGAPATFGITDQDFSGFCSVSISTDENGIRHAQYRDAFDRLRREIADSGGAGHLNLTTRYEYDLEGRLRLSIAPSGDTTRYWYDALGRVRYKYHPDLGTTSYAYDDVGNVRFTQSEDQARTSRLTFSQYDDLNRLVLTGDAIVAGEEPSDTKIPRALSIDLDRLTDRFSPRVLHDSISPILTASKALFKDAEIPSPAFWDIGLLDSVTGCTLDPDTLLGETSSPTGPYLRHPVDYPEPVTSPTATAATFEDISRFPHFGRIAVSYDALPEVAGAIWKRFPGPTKWDYLAPQGKVRNLRGREAAVAWREHGGEPYHYAVMSYDERGRVEALIRYTENLGFDAVYYTYNSMNQVISVRVADPLRQFTTWYGHDWNGRVDTVWTHLSAVGSGIDVTYPRFPAPDTTRDWPADIVYTYSPTGQVATMKYDPINVLVSYAYNHRKWLDSMVVTQGGSPLFLQALTFDATGQVASQAWKHGAGARVTHTYGYDSIQRITKWFDGTDTTTYVYDAVGNQTFRSRTGVIDATSSVYSDPVGPDRVSQTIRNTAFGITTTNYGYDHNGAVTGMQRTASLGYPGRDSLIYSWRGLTRQLLHYDYDSAGVTSSFDWRYRYSPGGEREQKRLFAQQDAAHNPVDHNSWVYYLLGGRKEQLAVYHGQEATAPLCAGQGGTEVYMYPAEYLTYGNGSFASVVSAPGKTKEYRIADHLGSVRVSIGAATNWYAYDPWGEPLATVPDRVGYIGKEVDRESGLGDFGVRKRLGPRFLSADPLWETYPGWSPYHYARNNPLVLSDPSGLGDYLDQEGNVLGSDGQSDGKIYSTTKELYGQYAGDQDFQGLRNERGTEEWPSKDLRDQIYQGIYQPARFASEDREHGGIIVHKGEGPQELLVASPGYSDSQSGGAIAGIVFTELVAQAKSDGKVLDRLIHTHPYFSGGDIPSSTDKSMMAMLSGVDHYPLLQSGIIISPTRQSVSFYDSKGVTARVPLKIFFGQ